ncbi:MAG: SoxR reducing system RseC family protein [Candidatus Omnitrophota bacterium]
MKEQGTVITRDADTATVRIEKSEACSKCCSCKAAETRTVILSGEAAKGLKTGDRVEIGAEPSTLLRVYSVLYLVPLIVFAGTVFTAFKMIKDPIKSFFIAIVLTSATYVIIGKKWKK